MVVLIAAFILGSLNNHGQQMYRNQSNHTFKMIILMLHAFLYKVYLLLEVDIRHHRKSLTSLQHIYSHTQLLQPIFPMKIEIFVTTFFSIYQMVKNASVPGNKKTLKIVYNISTHKIWNQSIYLDPRNSGQNLDGEDWLKNLLQYTTIYESGYNDETFKLYLIPQKKKLSLSLT